MSGKKTLIALSTAIALGLAGSTAALASDHEDQSGGFKIGPLGQPMGGPSEWGASGAYSGGVAYGFLPHIRTPASPPARTKRRHSDWRWKRWAAHPAVFHLRGRPT